MQANLLEIHRETAALRQSRLNDQAVLAINRSDYMLDEPSSTLMQVLACATAQGKQQSYPHKLQLMQDHMLICCNLEHQHETDDMKLRSSRSDDEIEVSPSLEGRIEVENFDNEEQ